jgi:transposase-like protein
MSQSLKVLRRATTARRQADADWRQAIVAARRDGHSFREIGKAASVSHTRIQQIIEEIR